MAKRFSTEWWLGLRPEIVGKETERLVQSILVNENRRSGFAYHRFPDAKSARGVLAAQPADYLICSDGKMVLLEVKALKHAFRLPKARLTQHAVMCKFALAGAYPLVITHHYTEGVWRVTRADELEQGVPSWDLRPYPTFESAQAALDSVFLDSKND